MSGKAFSRYESTRDPALRPDGKPYCEAVTVPATEVRVDDLFPGLGTVMSVQPLANGELLINGRLLHRKVDGKAIFTVVRRNWEPVP